MRQIGTIPDESQAKTFADYLLTLNIPTRVDPSAKGGYVIWVRREEQVDRAKGELGEFLKAPEDAKYQGVSQAAREIRKQAERLEREHQRKSINLRGRWDYRPAERCMLTLLLMGISVFVSVISQFGEDSRTLEPLYFTPYLIAPQSLESLAREGDVTPEEARRRLPYFAFRGGGLRWSSGLGPILQGQVWRLITPIFIHFGFFHLLFNMFWLYDLGGLIEMRKGTVQLAILVLVSAVLSNAAQFLWSSYRYHGIFVPFGGMSGVVYALFGYVWTKSRHEPTGGMALRGNTVAIMLIFLALGFTSVLDHITGPMANLAHLGGLLVGMAFGLAPHWRDELRKWT